MMRMKTGRIKNMGAMFSLYRGLPAGIYALFFARMVNAMGNFVFPFLTMLLTDRYGYPPAEAGRFVFLASISFIPGSILGGKISDRFGRKKVMLVSQGLCALCFIPCGFLGNSPLVPWFILAGYFMIGAARPAMQAMTADLSTPENRKAAFSLTYLGNNIGFAVGPIVAGVLYKNHSGWIFWGNVLTIFLATTLIQLFVRESLPSKERIERSRYDRSHERAESGSTLKALLNRPYLIVFIVLNIVAGFVYSQHLFSLPIQLDGMFPDRGPEYFGFLMSANAVVVVFFTTPLIALTSRFSPVVNQAFAALLYGIGFGMLFCIRSFPLYVLSTVFWSLGEILAATNSNVYIANHTPITHRGRFNAVIPIITGVGQSACPLLMGGFISVAGLPSVWILSFFLACAGAAGFFVLDGIERSSAHRRKG